MPLPAALAARLQRRGIIKSEEKPAAKTKERDQSEEVFAEDYDDEGKTADPASSQSSPEPAPEKPSEALIYEVPACPNRSNRYHECVAYCQEHYGFKTFIHNAEIDHKRHRMLDKYPLPENWQEVGDPETNRYYYWNMDTDEVSWLSPLHPRSVLTPGIFADMLKGVLHGGVIKETKEDAKYSSNAKDVENMEQDFETIEREVYSEKKHERSGRERKHDRRERERDRDRDRDKEKDKRGKRRKRGDDDELDPMDPASYSDVQRGTWSTGLDRSGEAKTGVDVTASGPLFQQRPYPSPGAVLRANKQMQDPSKD